MFKCHEDDGSRIARDYGSSYFGHVELSDVSLSNQNDNSNPETALAKAELETLVQTALGKIQKDRNKGVLKSLYYDGRTTTEISGDYDVTPARISQNKKQALQQLRKEILRLAKTSDIEY